MSKPTSNQIFLKECVSNLETQDEARRHVGDTEDKIPSTSKESYNATVAAFASVADLSPPVEVPIKKPSSTETVVSESDNSDIEYVWVKSEGEKDKDKEKPKATMPEQSKEITNHEMFATPLVSSSTANTATSSTATALLPLQQIDASAHATNLNNMSLGLTNQALQLPLSSPTGLSTNTPVVGGLTGQNIDLFMQGYAAAQANAVAQAQDTMSNLNMAANSMFNLPAFHALEDKRLPREETAAEKYRDFSTVPVSLEETECESSTTGKDPPFPVKLHRILSNPEYADLISWLPHGRSWRVLKPKAFEEKIIPRYFRHTKYASFMRQVNGWGFKRMTQGPDHNSYYHELFLRGIPHLCTKMRRPTRAKLGQHHSNNTPDFYRLNLVAPLPKGDGTPGGTPGPAAGIAPTFGNELLNLAGLQNAPNATDQVGVRYIPATGMDSSINHANHAILSQNLQGVLPQNLGALSQLSGLNSSLQGLSGGICNIAGSSNADINQLDALRQRKDDLMFQLQGLQASHQLQGLQVSQNPLSTVGTVQLGAGIQPSPSQLGTSGNQLQHMINIPDNITSGQMGGLLQYSGLGMNGSHDQMNMGSMVGNAQAQQQLLMQQNLMGANNANLGNIGMGNNNLFGA